MNPAKCQDTDYIQWLIASPRIASCTEAARANRSLVSHDAYTRLLERLEPDSDALWHEVRGLVQMSAGFLIVDDTTLDKPYARHIDLVTRHWSGKHRRVVQGINLVTLLWSDGDIAIPVDWRVFDKARDSLTKNDHLRQMLQTARQRGFSPERVLFDSWYSSLENLKMLREFGWGFFVGIKSNRHADPDGTGNRQVRALQWGGEHAMMGHLKGFGWVQLYRVGVADADEQARFFASSGPALDEAQLQGLREVAAQIEGYHRGLKQECLVERCQARSRRKQKNHIGLAIRAFVRLELARFTRGLSRFELKARLLRPAIGLYLQQPLYTLSPPTA